MSEIVTCVFQKEVSVEELRNVVGKPRSPRDAIDSPRVDLILINRITPHTRGYFNDHQVEAGIYSQCPANPPKRNGKCYRCTHSQFRSYNFRVDNLSPTPDQVICGIQKIKSCALYRSKPIT